MDNKCISLISVLAFLVFNIGYCLADERFIIIDDNDRPLSGDIWLYEIQGNKILDDGIEIMDQGYMRTKISSCEDEWSAYSSYDSFTNIIMFAFTKWCGKLLMEESEFDVYLFPYETPNNTNVGGGSGRPIMSQEANTCFNPQIKDISLRKSLLDNKIVVAIRTNIETGLVVVNLDAIIPFHGEYFRYKNTFTFERQLNFGYFGPNDAAELSQRIGHSFSNYVDKQGKIYFSFFWKDIRWRFKSMENHKIQRIKVYPQLEKITIKSLFYE